MKHKLASLMLVPLLLSVGSCGVDDPSEGPALPPIEAGAPTAASTSDPGPSAGATTPARDDLASGRARHLISSGGFKMTVDYETRKPGTPWTTGGEKPLRVELRVNRSKKRVYLTRVTLRFSTDDGTGDIPGPEPIVDSSTNINPGYLVAPPYSYVQSFAVPVVDPSTRGLTIDIKFELVSLVDVKTKDYTKQTVTDTLRTVVQE